jgi:fido (protein-threonine AMPylation protein)
VGYGAPLFRSRSEKDALEARNGRLQYRLAIELIEVEGAKLTLAPEIIKRLHHAAIKDIYSCAGEYRTWSVNIGGSSHKPPEHRYVPDCVDELCETFNARTDWDPIEAAAYLLWRLAWIHPFGGGNGRTARVLCYLGLCARHGSKLPGDVTIPTQIVNDRDRFIEALKDADRALKCSAVIDVGELKILMDDWLKKQLASVPARPSVSQPHPAPFPSAAIRSSWQSQLPPTDE